VAVGNLDGVHRGHQALVAATIENARRRGRAAVVLTLDPHPARLLAPDRAPAAIMTLAQKAESLEALGVDALLVLPFTQAVAAQVPRVFAASVLVRDLAASVVVVGENFRFGHDRVGTLATLEELGRELGFEVAGVPAVLHEGVPVSSSRIRQAISQGQVEEAALMLGRPHRLDGQVVEGEGRGRTIGVPTANVLPYNEIRPGKGVYACHVRLGPGGPGPGPADLRAVVNVGERPTFGGIGTTIEAHLLDFQGDLYGQTLRLEFAARIRGEQRFASADELVAQIQRDIASARRMLEKP
jgi:riboflavin kinase / FMN adenylyltransferase